MTFDEFVASLKLEAPPSTAGSELRALWFDARGDWDAAHAIAQEIGSKSGSSIHAYLHRKEGDLPNARYWYGQAGVTTPSGSLEAEWEALVKASL